MRNSGIRKCYIILKLKINYFEPQNKEPQNIEVKNFFLKKISTVRNSLFDIRYSRKTKDAVLKNDKVESLGTYWDGINSKTFSGIV